MCSEIRSLGLPFESLPSGLSEIVLQGFCERSGCTFLMALVPIKTNVSIDDFQDKTGCECFFNSVHIDDYVSDDYLICAFLLVDSVFSAWRQRGVKDKLMAVVSSDGLGVLVKFYVEREGEAWLSGDLEGYEQSVLVADSVEKVFVDSVRKLSGL
jgi:hypothetical protein